MPIRPELRHFYGALWKVISHYVRFVRADGKCESCGRTHGQVVYELADGRIFDKNWKYPSGKLAPYPTLIDWLDVRTMTVYIATAHRDHNPEHNTNENLMALCQWCHLKHDRQHHLETYRSRLAIRDLFDNS